MNAAADTKEYIFHETCLKRDWKHIYFRYSHADTVPNQQNEV